MIPKLMEACKPIKLHHGILYDQATEVLHSRFNQAQICWFLHFPTLSAKLCSDQKKAYKYCQSI